MSQSNFNRNEGRTPEQDKQQGRHEHHSISRKRHPFFHVTYHLSMLLHGTWADDRSIRPLGNLKTKMAGPFYLCNPSQTLRALRRADLAAVVQTSRLGVLSSERRLEIHCASESVLPLHAWQTSLGARTAHEKFVNVRSRRSSGKHLLGMSISHFDPKQTTLL
jgi:hypothetical protein